MADKKIILLDLGGTLLDPDESGTDNWSKLIAELRANGHTICVATFSKKLTNFDRLFLQGVGIDPDRDPVIKSCEKTYPETYREIAKHFGVATKDLVLIDDGERGRPKEGNRHIKAAEKAGAIGIHYTSVGDVHAELQKLGIL